MFASKRLQAHVSAFQGHRDNPHFFGHTARILHRRRAIAKFQFGLWASGRSFSIQYFCSISVLDLFCVDQFPYSSEMMVVVFGDKVQMVDEAHWRLQTRVRNGKREE